MVRIQPFIGLRYAAEQIDNDYSLVTAPPYDVISPEQQEALHAKHPLNIVRLILGLKTAADNDADSVYTRAKATLDQWLASESMRPETAPAIYAYSQSWDDHGQKTTRTGFIARLEVAPYEAKAVLPHEFTLAGPKVDRLNLTRATQTTLSPIFCVYNDASMLLETRVFGQAPPADAIHVTDPDGVQHVFWPVTDPSFLADLQAMLADKSVIIADGHHRYETALAYQVEKGAGGGMAPQDFTLSFFCNTQSPGLRVYPTHRILKSLPNNMASEAFLAAVKERFEPTAQESEIVFWLQETVGGAKTGYRVKPGVSLDALDPLLQTLDVALLDQLVFQEILNTPANQLKQDGHVVFIRDDQEVADALNTGAICAFWMHAPNMDQVEAICQSGLRMPQKSTYFYPKLLSGLVLYPHFLNVGSPALQPAGQLSS